MNVASQYTLKDLSEKIKGHTDPVEELLNEILYDFIRESLNKNDDGPENMLSMKEDMEHTCQESSNIDRDKCQEQYHQDGSKKADSTKSQLNGNTTNGSASFDFNPSKPATSDKKDNEENADHQQPVQTVCTLSSKDERLSSQITSKQHKNDPGETSFSATDHPGPIPYSRNDSTQSDGSAASTQSFAFPILHSEWKSSPVKIFKPDQEHVMIRKRQRKHRSRWRCLICCRT